MVFGIAAFRKCSTAARVGASHAGRADSFASRRGRSNRYVGHGQTLGQVMLILIQWGKIAPPGQQANLCLRDIKVRLVRGKIT